MLLEGFSILKFNENLKEKYTPEEDWSIETTLVFLFVLVYIFITIYTAYNSPINFYNLLGKVVSSKFRFNYQLNLLLNFILVLVSSVIFWFIKLIEFLITRKQTNPKNHKKNKKIYLTNSSDNFMDNSDLGDTGENGMDNSDILEIPKPKKPKSKRALSMKKLSFGKRKKSKMSKPKRVSRRKKIFRIPKHYYDPIF